MKHFPTWHTEIFTHGDSTIELTINYQTSMYSITHGHNDNNVTFNGCIGDFNEHMDRVKCVEAALRFAKKELNKQ